MLVAVEVETEDGGRNARFVDLCVFSALSLVVGNQSSSVRPLSSERQQVQRGEIARRVVKEHVFRARVGRSDGSGGWTRVPVVDGGVELQAGIGRRPCRIADLLPQIAGLHGLGDLAGLGTPGEI